MNAVIRPALLSLCLAQANARAVTAQAEYAAPILAGLSNHGQTGGKPYVTAGTRMYVIGTQDGNFPDLGDHLPGEMGGAWLHPIKLIDGFRATVTEPAANRDVALSASTDFITYPYGNRFAYGPVLDSLEIERFQFSPDGREGFIVQYDFRNAAGRPRELTFRFAVKTDLRPVWFSDRLGITDAPDTVGWEPTSRLFVARDTGHPWFCVWGATGSADARPVADPPPIRTSGMGVTAASRYTVSVAPHGSSTLTFVVAGSASGQECGGRDLPRSGQGPCEPACRSEGALCVAARAGTGHHPRPAPAGGLQLGEGQHRVAGQRGARNRPRSGRRADGIPLVVRDRRKLFPAGDGRDGQCRARQADAPPAEGPVAQGQRQRPDRARGDDQRRGGQSGQHAGNRPVHHGRGQGLRLDRGRRLRPGDVPRP